MSAPGLPAFADAWLRQRAAAVEAVAAVEEAELRALSEEEALRQADALLAATPTDALPESRRGDSGFVEQQRLFARARVGK